MRPPVLDTMLDVANLEAADLSKFGYLRAAAGEAPPLDPRFVERYGGDLADVIHRAKDAIIYVRMSSYSEREPGWMSADDVVSRAAEVFDLTEKQQREMLSYALDLAKADTRYWGVTDPTKQAYCSKCREPRDIEMFRFSDYRCDLHYKEEGGA